jgi:hypothetical protein
MKISAFKIGLVLVVIGMIWVSVIFNETGKNHDSTLLKESKTLKNFTSSMIKGSIRVVL